jgi:hypothetical protein
MKLPSGLQPSDKWKPDKAEFTVTLEQHAPFKYMDAKKRTKAIDADWKVFNKGKKTDKKSADTELHNKE